MKEEVKLNIIELTNGFLIENPREGYNRSDMNNFEFDGKTPEKTFHYEWFFTPTLDNPMKIIPEVNTPISRKLKDGILPTMDRPAELPLDADYSYDLYETLYETIPATKAKIEIEQIYCGKVENVEKTKGFSFKVRNPEYPDTKSGYTINESRAIHQKLDEIIFPKPLLATRPIKLSSVDSYEIIRNYIKDNINPKHAEITSDYAFCLTVEKKIPLSEPQSYRHNENAFSRRKPKYTTRFVSERKLKVFETAPDRGPREGVYSGYTRCKEFEGESYEDLIKNIDAYLKELIGVINKPLVDCPKCKGDGVIVTKA